MPSLVDAQSLSGAASHMLPVLLDPAVKAAHAREPGRPPHHHHPDACPPGRRLGNWA